jgi:hypothetical protein
MAKKNFITKEIRENEGKFSFFSGDIATFSVNHHGFGGNCEACGKEIKNWIAVKAPDGMILFVGSECAHILTGNDKLDTGTIFSEKGKDLVAVNGNSDWFKKLESFVLEIGKDRYGAPCYYLKSNVNPFILSIYEQAKTYGKLSPKQYNKINEMIG